ncbi:MAG: TIGR03747 family integrating conjugative element membrane protein [Candidatus Thiodiazotropha weberae]|nr:TIGR03747 family integrating conjugative element membrane protein [Candidatus Thiodiazotropha weberae]
MASTATASNHPQHKNREIRERRTGVISNTFNLIISLLGWMVLALILNIVVEVAGIAFNWWELSGSQHARQVLVQELNWLNSDFKQALGNPLSIALTASKAFYQVIWVWDGKDFGQAILGSIGSGSLYDYFRAALWTIQVFAVRLVVILFSLPIFIAFGLVALTDGLLQRDLRRFGGGRESGYIWHHAMRMLKPSIIAPVVIYLGLPISIHPNLVVLPFAVIFSISLWIGAAWFKKYL